MPATSPLPLLTIRRISELTSTPVSAIERLLDENPGIRPSAVADFRPVYDRDAFLRILSLVDQDDAATEAEQ